MKQLVPGSASERINSRCRKVPFIRGLWIIGVQVIFIKKKLYSIFEYQHIKAKISGLWHFQFDFKKNIEISGHKTLLKWEDYYIFFLLNLVVSKHIFWRGLLQSLLIIRTEGHIILNLLLVYSYGRLLSIDTKISTTHLWMTSLWRHYVSLSSKIEKL